MKSDYFTSDSLPAEDIDPLVSPASDVGPLKGLARLFYRPNVWIAAAMVLLFAALLFVYMYTFMGHFMFVNIPAHDSVPPWVTDMERDLGVSPLPVPTPAPGPDHLKVNELDQPIGLMIMTAGIAFLEWPIIALSLHWLSRFAGGKASFANAASAIGYTYLPRVVAATVMILIVATLPVYQIDVSDYQESDLLKYADPAMPYNLAIKYVSLAGVLCSSVLGVIAIRYSERIRWRAAALIVGVPLLLYLGYYLYR